MLFLTWYGVAKPPAPGGLGPYEQHPILFIGGGGFRAGTRCESPSSAVDIAPTVLRHLGLPFDGMDGAPLPRG